MTFWEDKMEKQKTCFVICPLGEENSPIRKRSDQIFTYIINDIVKNYGYKPVRADQIQKAGLITIQVLQYLVDSELVIADLSNHNPNVFYELAIRHSTQKPVIQLIEKDEKIPFDIARLRTIYINTNEFALGNIEQVKKELSGQIKSLKEWYKIENLIFDALRLKFLKESADPEKVQLADLLQELINVKGEILSIKNSLPATYRSALTNLVFHDSLGTPDGFVLGGPPPGNEGAMKGSMLDQIRSVIKGKKRWKKTKKGK